MTVHILLLCFLAAVLSTLAVQAAGKTLRCPICTRTFTADSPTRFRITRVGGKELVTNCAHCGLTLVGHLKDVVSVTTYDYTSGQEVNAEMAFYVENSHERACCRPSVLAFATNASAIQFQKEHAGSVVSYQDALKDALGKQ
jgi:hypothetical protein